MLAARCQRRENTLFLLHGTKDQSLRYFMLYIEHSSGSAGLPAHQVVTLPRWHSSGRSVLSAEEWEYSLWVALMGLSGGQVGPHRSIEELLRRLTQERQLFLLLGNRPFESLSPAEQAGLGRFLSHKMPELLARSAPAGGVRLLLAVEYPAKEGQSLVPLVDQWANDAAQRGLAYCRLPRVELPNWEDVKSFLSQRAGIKRSPETISAIQDWYNQFSELDRSVTFGAFASELELLLEQD